MVLAQRMEAFLYQLWPIPRIGSRRQIHRLASSFFGWVMFAEARRRSKIMETTLK